MLLWEYATAVAGRIIGINPFDQPDVESAKAGRPRDARGRRLLAHAVFVDGPVTVYASEGWLPEGTATVAAAVAALLDQLDAEHGYLAVQAYLDRHRDAALAPRARRAWPRAPAGRPPSAGDRGSCTPPASTTRAVPPTGVYLQVTGQPEADLAVPTGRSPSRSSSTAQAVGDGQVLADQGRPVLRLHVTTRATWRRTEGTRVTSASLEQATRCGTPTTGGSRGSPAPAGWCSSASPVTWRARR